MMKLARHLRPVSRLAGLRYCVGLSGRLIHRKALYLQYCLRPSSLAAHRKVGAKCWWLARKAILNGALHRHVELAAMFRLARDLCPSSVLEIGLSAGGTFSVWPVLASDHATIVGLDLNKPDSSVQPVFKPQQKVEYVIADSHHEKTLSLVARSFPEGIDMLFIDGDHSYDGVKADFEMYGRLVRPEGIICLHDINADWRHTRGVISYDVDSGEVFRFWRELRKQDLRVEELIEETGQDGYGIGVVYGSKCCVSSALARR